MLIKFIIAVYFLGVIASVLDLSNELNEASENTLGFWFSLIYVLYRKESYKHILQSWYYLHKQ